MAFIDTHAHIYLTEFDEDIDQIIQRAAASSVTPIYMPNIDTSSIEPMLNLEASYPLQCRSMIGLHPCSVKTDFENELKKIEDWLNRKEFAGIGETGTDLYWDKTYIEQQIESLKIQTGWAVTFDLPIILHSRNSLDLSIRIIEENYLPGLTGIFHCFTGTLEQATRITDLGFYIGIGGVLTFKNSKLANLLENISLEHIVLETDSPYLAPVPYRGKRNEPALVPLIAAKLAEVYKTSIEEIAKTTTENARKVFRKA
jgi:TatD DNase family protein